jgi:hypothetical protein
MDYEKYILVDYKNIKNINNDIIGEEVKKIIIEAVLLVACTILGIFIGSIAYSRHKGDRYHEQLKNRPTNQVVKTTPQVSSYPEIDVTLWKVAEDFKNKKDVNHDMLVNCIDAALLFYQYYPDKSKVCIELNYNTTTKFNHLFNCVLVDGIWRAIEPQTYAYVTGRKSYWMKDIWGDKYDKQYNKDVTASYVRFVKEVHE